MIIPIAGEVFGGTPPDCLGSATSGPFSVVLVHRVPSYFEDNLLALRHWQPPGA